MTDAKGDPDRSGHGSAWRRRCRRRGPGLGRLHDDHSTTDDTTSTTQTTTGDDISGPCDEAEHANDPECLPGGEDFEQARDDRFDDDCGFDDDDGVDNSGPGSVSSGHDDDDDHFDDDSSGHGSSGSDDDGDDDSSGHGSGDDD